MAAPNSQINGHATDHYTKEKNANDWPFQGNTYPEIRYEDNFEADISAIADSNDSGYFSSENVESNNDNITRSDNPKISYPWSTDSLQGDSYSGDTAASAKANHLSIYDGVKKENTATIEKTASPDGHTLKSPRARLHDDFEDLSLPTYSEYSDYFLSTAPTWLQTWVQIPERHESIAYKLEQPAKRRKTSKGRH